MNSFLIGLFVAIGIAAIVGVSWLVARKMTSGLRAEQKSFEDAFSESPCEPVLFSQDEYNQFCVLKENNHSCFSAFLQSSGQALHYLVYVRGTMTVPPTQSGEAFVLGGFTAVAWNEEHFCVLNCQYRHKNATIVSQPQFHPRNTVRLIDKTLCFGQYQILFAPKIPPLLRKNYPYQEQYLSEFVQAFSGRG
jgi:hypothetical protein